MPQARSSARDRRHEEDDARAPYEPPQMTKKQAAVTLTPGALIPLQPR